MEQGTWKAATVAVVVEDSAQEKEFPWSPPLTGILLVPAGAAERRRSDKLWWHEWVVMRRVKTAEDTAQTLEKMVAPP